jgi:hypothetical protein
MKLDRTFQASTTKLKNKIIRKLKLRKCRNNPMIRTIKMKTRKNKTLKLNRRKETNMKNRVEIFNLDNKIFYYLFLS